MGWASLSERERVLLRHSIAEITNDATTGGYQAKVVCTCGRIFTGEARSRDYTTSHGPIVAEDNALSRALVGYAGHWRQVGKGA